MSKGKEDVGGGERRTLCWVEEWQECRAGGRGNVAHVDPGVSRNTGTHTQDTLQPPSAGEGCRGQRGRPTPCIPAHLIAVAASGESPGGEEPYRA